MEAGEESGWGSTAHVCIDRKETSREGRGVQEKEEGRHTGAGHLFPGSSKEGVLWHTARVGDLGSVGQGVDCSDLWMERTGTVPWQVNQDRSRSSPQLGTMKPQ